MVTVHREMSQCRVTRPWEAVSPAPPTGTGLPCTSHTVHVAPTHLNIITQGREPPEEGLEKGVPGLEGEGATRYKADLLEPRYDAWGAGGRTHGITRTKGIDEL